MTTRRREVVATVRDAVARFAPGRADYRGIATSWRHDVVAGITVGVVALPLALAFAIAADLSPAVGLTTAIVAGLVAAVFGGSDLQVSGPTGAMAVVLLPVVARFGAGPVPTVGLIDGVLVLVAGMARLGRVVAGVAAGVPPASARSPPRSAPSPCPRSVGCPSSSARGSPSPCWPPWRASCRPRWPTR